MPKAIVVFIFVSSTYSSFLIQAMWEPSSWSAWDPVASAPNWTNRKQLFSSTRITSIPHTYYKIKCAFFFLFDTMISANCQTRTEKTFIKQKKKNWTWLVEFRCVAKKGLFCSRHTSSFCQAMITIIACVDVCVYCGRKQARCTNT